MRKWRRLKPSQFTWYYTLIVLWGVSLLALLALYIFLRKTSILVGMVAMCSIGVLCIATAYLLWGKHMRISKQMETFIRRNELYQSHYVTEQGILGETKVERMDYYPIVQYKEMPKNNVFCIRIRLDGCRGSKRFNDMEQELADMFSTVCVEKIMERGYLTYCFELREQQQTKIQSCNDIPKVGEHEIAFSKDVNWDWKQCPHFLLVGNTGSGKTLLAQYLISCLLEQGVRIIYCDPKKDDDMRLFMQSHPSVRYVTTENEIAMAVRETEEEVRSREMDLESIGIKEAEFNPIFLFFDEMIAFAKIANKKTYEEVEKRLSAIVVTGRSKRVYVGMILQRCDTEFLGGGAIRDNLGCRICMGQMSNTAYKMAFGSDFSNVRNNRREIGSGLIYRQGVDTKPREFLAPYICKGALSKRE